MAKAATLSIVEAENIVPIGSIDPNDVDLPGIFVDRVVPATDEKHIELKKLRSADDEHEAKTDKDAGMTQRNLIARRAAKELKKGYYVNLGVGRCLMLNVPLSCLHKLTNTCAKLGIPTLAPSFLPEGVNVWVQSENGILGMVGQI